MSTNTLFNMDHVHKLSIQSCFLTYIFIHSSLILLVRNEMNTLDSFCGVCAYWYFAESHYMWYICFQGIKEDPCIFIEKEMNITIWCIHFHIIFLCEDYLQIHQPCGHFVKHEQKLFNWISILPFDSLSLPNERDQYFGKISYRVSAVIIK